MSRGEPPRPTADQLASVVEALIFASGEPVRPAEIASAIADVPLEEIEAAIDDLERRYARQGSGLRVERIAGGVQLATRSELGTWVRQFFRERNRTRISAAALETLAIVAYRQPVTAPEIQTIRGKDSSASLRTLLEKGLIRISGKKKVVGSPFLYGTSRQFLVHFGLDSLKDLPAMEEFDQLAGVLEELQGGEAEADAEGDQPVTAAMEELPVDLSPAGVAVQEE